ncbi:MAG: hypothetical protein WB347_21500 [Terriglobales bacterium]
MLQSHGQLQGCIAYCAYCGIRFLTHPRNAGRRNLRCPFGCREHHRRQQSCQRSTAYYQTAAGKAKKKRLNGRRRWGQVPPAAAPQSDLADALSASALSPVTVEPRREDVALDESSLVRSPMLPYVRMVVSLIEGVHFTCREVVHRLRRTLRQRRIGAGRGADYLRGVLHRHPP